MQIFCCACQVEVEARLTDGVGVYPHRPDLASLPFWQCPTCKNFVGCHHKTKDRLRPLGCIPTAEMKTARKHIHQVLDPIWKSGAMTRGAVYAHVSAEIGREYHTAELRTIEEARAVYRIARRLARSL